MAKDGTARGGTRAGAGRKSKALVDKIKDGNPGGARKNRKEPVLRQ